MTTSGRIDVHEPFHSAPSTSRHPGGIFQNVRNSMQSHCQTCQTTSCRDIEHLLRYNRLIKGFFLVPLMCCFFRYSSLLLWTTTRHYDICVPAFLSNSDSSLYSLHTLQVSQFGSKTPCILLCIHCNSDI
ncbi:hypothetical protein TNCV_1253991 [Trichonephila clavipes]|nr:hypothetical protein TNCV_1253991 [Trichonephila clavipes]